MVTPVKAVKGEEQVIRQMDKAADDLFSTAVSTIRQPIESLFNWLNEKNINSKSDEGQVYSWTSNTYDGENCHRVYFSNFLSTDSHK